MRKIRFKLPPEGSLTPNTKDDPLKYYYCPIVGFLYRNRIQKGLNLLDESYDSVLEVGYGSGLLLPTITKIGNKVTGLDRDSDPKLVEKDLKKIDINVKLLQGDILDTKLPKESFDLVIAFSIFEHIKDTKTAVKEMYRILKPGGNLLVGMPRVDKLMEKLFPLIGCKTIKEQHVTSYKEFLDSTKEDFTLEKFSKMPRFLPSIAGIYFNMLLKKKQ